MSSVSSVVKLRLHVTAMVLRIYDAWIIASVTRYSPSRQPMTFRAPHFVLGSESTKILTAESGLAPTNVNRKGKYHLMTV